MPRWNLITNLTNGVGLQREAGLIEGLLRAHGQEVRPIHFDDRGHFAGPPADVNLFDEIIVPELFPQAREQWVFIHPDWWYPAWTPLLSECRYVLCKTRAAEELSRKLVARLPGPRRPEVRYTGFMCIDQYDPAVKRERKFLHLAGKSLLKNTEAVISAWARGPVGAQLVLVSQNHRPPANREIELHRRLPEDELRRLMNECQFHVMPSAYEGYGHALHEAESVGAVILTLDMPPMTDVTHDPRLLAVPKLFTKHYSCVAGITTGEQVRQTVDRALQLTPPEIEELSRRARAHFESERADFKQRFQELVEAAEGRTAQTIDHPLIPSSTEEGKREDAMPTIARGGGSDPPLVSVIMPTKDRTDLLAQAVGGFKRQTYANKELVVYNTGQRPVVLNAEDATDTSMLAVPGITMPGVYEDPEENIRVFWPYPLDRHLRIGEVRNQSVAQARGEIIIHMDDDDWYAPDYLAQMVAWLLDSGKQVVGFHRWHYADVVNKRFYVYQHGFAPYAHGASQCYRRTWWTNHHFAAKQLGEDQDFSNAARKFKALASRTDDALLLSRVHGGNTATQAHDMADLACFEEIDELPAALRPGIVPPQHISTGW